MTDAEKRITELEIRISALENILMNADQLPLLGPKYWEQYETALHQARAKAGLYGSPA